ncbi:MAG: ABC transporter substrate-binding protein [Bdellovibrionales bacterium]
MLKKWLKICAVVFFLSQKGYGQSKNLETYNYISAGAPNRLLDFDPRKFTTAHTRYALQLVFENLVKRNYDQELEPGLASNWKINFDNQTLLLNLAKGRMFSDGTPVTAHAVKSSIEELCSPQSNARLELKNLKGCLSSKKPKINVINDFQLKLESNGNPQVLLYQLSSLRVLIFKESGGKLIGTGPYFVEAKKDQHLVLKKNPLWNNSKNVANPGIIINFYKLEDEIVQALKSEKIHVSVNHMIETDSLQVLSNYNRIQDQADVTFTLTFNNQRVPFNKKPVRTYIASRILEEETRIRKCRAANTKPALGIIPKGIGGSISHQKNTQEKPPGNLVRLKSPIKITIIQHIGRKNLCEAQIIKSIMDELNIKAEYEYFTDYSLLLDKYAQHDFDAFVELYNIKNRDAYSVLRYFQSENNKENLSNISDATLDEFLSEALKSPTAGQRFSWYRKVVQRIFDNAYVAPLYYTITSSYYHKCLHGASHRGSFNPFIELMSMKPSDSCPVILPPGGQF